MYLPEEKVIIGFLAVLALLTVALGGCATPRIDETKVGATSAMLAPAAPVLAEGRRECQAKSTSPGWFLRALGWPQTVTAVVSCD